MTKKLFYLDPYLKEFYAKVVSIEGSKVTLDQTVFFATAGGQTGDTGEINGMKVVETVYDENRNIIHIIDGEPNFQVGDRVLGKIDWDRRYHIMRLHSACHVICGVIRNHFPDAMFTGSNIYPDRARIDFNVEKLDDEIAKMIENESNETAQRGLPIVAKMITWDDVERDPSLMRVDRKLYQKYGEPRITEIIGFDKQLDGGTHVASTKEIGKIKLTGRENKGKNNRRIYITVE